MKKILLTIIITILVTASFSGVALSGPDQYIGDTAIYSGSTQFLRPNVLIVFDNNSTMDNSASGDPYDPGTTYAGSYDPYTVYKVTATYVAHVANSTDALENVSCASAKTLLQAFGTYTSGSGNGLKSNGTCGNGGQNLVYLGNLLNYNEGSSASATATQAEIVKAAVETVTGGARFAVNFGVMVFNDNKSGGKILKKIADISDDADFNDFIDVLPSTPITGEPLLSGNGRPLAEALYDAGAYFKEVDASNSAYPIIGGDVSLLPYPSPIQYECQKNFVIVITNGDTDGDNNPKLVNPTDLGTVGDYDSDGMDSANENSYGLGTHFMDDVAKFIYENDMSSSLDGTQRVITHGIQIFSSYKDLVERATDSSHGRGSYHVASDANALSDALAKVMTNIVLESDTSFVAPVVPVSPENKTYSGSRVYMGFFKPISQKMWYGNLKKYGIDSTNNILDKDDLIANYVDSDRDGVDDNTSTALPAGATHGSFKSSSVSFWSSLADGGVVESGGAGELLLTRDFGTDPRKLYTYTGSNTALTHSSNAFTTGNTDITDATLGNPAGGKNDLINFVHGIDSYDEDGDANTTEKRGWILGDILHARPLVVSYATFSFTPSTNEGDCNVNKSVIYVGANDGMLHAFADCDGKEIWAFTPQDLLPNLKYLNGVSHTYFVDSSPSVYIYDDDNDGNIETADGDKVVLIFGERRGGGVDTSPTTGFYYALDVSDPDSPEYMWRLSNTESPSGGAAFSELGETWSKPKITKIKLSGGDKIVAFVGAGYDNCNEDARYGATQTYPGACVTSPTNDIGLVTSSDGSNPTNPKGRGVYAVLVADLDGGGVPDVDTNGGTKVWGYTNADDASMTFSIPSEVYTLDSDHDGYKDRLYVGDTGGNLWRFDVGDTNTANWTGKKIFSANPGDGDNTDVGRKIFYKPSVAIDFNYTGIFFGTGDRAHPLNRDVLDKMYAVKDRGQASAKTESNLLDVTDNDLQDSSDLTVVNNILTALNNSSNYGWYIELDRMSNGEHNGEKVLASPLVFNKVAYFTTFAQAR